MFQRYWLCAVLAIAVALASGSTALADKILYDIGSASSVSAYDPPISNDGLEIHTQLKSGLDDISFLLGDGEHYTFAFFDIWTPETTVNPDDLNNQLITAVLDFDVPDIDATIGGETFGISIFGILQGGALQWSGPTVVTVSDRTFQVELSDETFNFGLFGLTEGEACGATVKAKVTQLYSHSTPPIVPTPTAALGGLALLSGLVLGRRRPGQSTLD
jgi:hypothetical protein